MDKNDFCSRKRLSCEMDLYLRGKLLEYKCKVKSHIDRNEKVKHYISEKKIHKFEF